jgi:Flp pilus assembly protein TadG
MSEDGSISLFVIAAVLALFVVFGLVVDGGRRLEAQRRAADSAEQAARAAAQAIDPTALRAGQPLRLDPATARQAAAAYLQAEPDMTLSAITVDDVTVAVTVTTTVAPQVLSLVGIGSLTVHATGHAELLTGTNAPTAGAAGRPVR